jgi:hypothetical protein
MLDTAVIAATTGYAASLTFDWLREQAPRPTQAQWAAGDAWWHLLWSMLYAPRYARVTVFLLAIGLATALSLVLALLTGRDTTLVAEIAWAVIASQVAQPQSRRVATESGGPHGSH